MKAKNELQWPKSPSKTQHRTLGPRQRWTTKCKRYRIERFPDDGDPLFAVMVVDGLGWRVIAHRRKLTTAQSLCLNHFRQGQRNNRIGRG